jgi:hypothetical protein
MNDPGFAAVDRELADAKAHKLVRDERYFWEHRAENPERPVVVFAGAEKWKQGPIARGELVECPGCDVPGVHYHLKEAPSAQGEG